MYENKPLSILIMPPINQSTNVEAKEFFQSTLHTPLANAGYYVVPSFLANEILQNEGAYDSELFIDQSLTAFGEIFGAELALFTVIHDWKKIGLLGNVYIEIEYIFKDVRTNEVMYTRHGQFTYKANKSEGGGLLGQVAGNLIATAMTKYVDVARQCNEITFKDLPLGKYHPKHGTDGNLRAGHQKFTASF
jgi:hypothetical protein